jgi:non-specific serine/threonine protein kinase/serine/threonine-protein kinase
VAQRRFASADHLAEDIRRYLEGRPVTAHSDSFSYRSMRFIQRHKAGVAAAVLVLAALVTAAVAAETQRRRAERRFNDLRQFANFVLNDLDVALRTEGITPARRKVVERGLLYLDGLAGEAAGDLKLGREVAAAYISLGDVQGNLYQANAGDANAARKSYEKALAIAERVEQRDANDAANRRLTARAMVKLADIEGITGKRQQALGLYRKALASYEGLLPSDSDRRGALLNILNVCVQIASTYDQINDYGAALESFRKCLPTAQALAGIDPAARGTVALSKERIAYFSARCGRTAGAEQEVRGALDIYIQIASARPGPRTQRNVAKGYKTLAEVQRAGGHISAATESARKSLTMLDALYERDPGDKRLQVDLHMGVVLLTDLLVAGKQLPEARKQTIRAVSLLRPLVEQPQPALHDLQDYVWIMVNTPFADLRDAGAAVRYAQQAVQATDGNDAESLDLLARAYALNGDYNQAAAAGRRAAALLAGVASSPRKTELERNVAAFETQALRQTASKH